MILAIDIGGTKTLLAVFTNNGQLKKSIKLATPKDYSKLISSLKAAIIRFEEYDFDYACVAIPGKVNRQKGIGIAFGNLKWTNIAIKKDVRTFIKCPIVIENDANLAGLFESRQILKDYKRVLYLTISTGIGSGITLNGNLDQELIESEAGHMKFQFGDKMLPWEDFASGRSIKKTYGKLASEINDRKTWKEISHRFSIGISSLIATIQPDAIVIGGSVGTYFHKYRAPLKNELKKLSTPLTPVPVILRATKPEEAVIYGCYELAKDKYYESS